MISGRSSNLTKTVEDTIDGNVKDVLKAVKKRGGAHKKD
jgi:hypothetical protein